MAEFRKPAPARRETREPQNARNTQNRRMNRGRGHRRLKRGKALFIALAMWIVLLFCVIFVFVHIIRGIAGLFSGPQETVQTTEAAPATEAASTEPETQSNIVTSNGRELDITKPMVALTFDDGPYAPVGNEIMDTLAANNGRATFFIVGNRVEQYQEEVKRMVSDGNEIGNHSYDHDEKLSKKDAQTIQWEFNACSEEINKVAGVTPAWIRLPGGIISDTVKQAMSVPFISWSVDTRDWKTRNTQSTIDAVVGHVQDGDIVLMHELYKSTGEACKTIIPQLVSQGFQLVTISELIQYRSNGALTPNVQYTDFYPTAAADSSAAESAAETAPTVDPNAETANLSEDAESEAGASSEGSSAEVTSTTGQA